jgi:hypothetical protein
MPLPTTPTAGMGYIGFVKVFGLLVRVTASNINIKQDITNPDIIDGRVDRTVYQLGPIEVDGTIDFPIILDSTVDFPKKIFEFALDRDYSTTGELINSGEVVVRYTFGQEFSFARAKVNTFKMTAAVEDAVSGSFELIGTTRTRTSAISIPAYLSPARVLTWDGVKIKGTGVGSFESKFVRNFEMNINNNVQRNYTFDPDAGFFPSNISTGKREIDGTLEFQGFAPTEETAADGNPTFVTSDDTIEVELGSSVAKTLHGIIYQHLDIASSTGVITSSVRWLAHGVEEEDYQAISDT